MIVRASGTHVEDPIMVHCIPKTRWLQSIPLLLKSGHDFFLTNKGTSYEFSRDKRGKLVAIPIGRTHHHPDGTASGYLVNSYTRKGQLVVQDPVPNDHGKSVAALHDALQHLVQIKDQRHDGHVVNEVSTHSHYGRFRSSLSKDKADDARLLHERLNHPSRDRLLRWTKVALGFPSSSNPSTRNVVEAAAEYCTSCDTCHVARDSRCKVPRASRVGRMHKKGATWSVDFTRTFSAPTPEGMTVALVCLERATRYLKVFLLPSHTEFWGALQSLVDWCAATVGTEIREIQADCDVVWSHGTLHTPTAQCIDFCTHNQIHFSRSPPYTQSMNTVEGAMGPLLGAMYAAMVHAHVGAPLWGDSLLHAATTLNMGPIPGKTIPIEFPANDPTGSNEDPRLEYSPQGALLGTLPDISLLAAPLFATAWVLVPGSKASQLHPKSRMGLYVGIAEGILGFKIRLLSDLSFVSSMHVKFDPNLANRPLALARRHELISGDGGRDTGTEIPTALEALYEHPLAKHDGTIVMFDSFTNMPVKLMASSDEEYGATLTEVDLRDEPPSSPLMGRRVRTSRKDEGTSSDGTITEHRQGPSGPTVLITYDDGHTLTVHESLLSSADNESDHLLLPASTTSHESHGDSPAPDHKEDTTYSTNASVSSSRASQLPRWQRLAKVRSQGAPGGGRRVIGFSNSTSCRNDEGSPSMSYNIKNKIKKLPGTTKIRFQQLNPKRGDSRDRYERYKAAVSVDQFLELGGRRADLLNDFERGYMNVPHLEALTHIIAPTLSLASTADLSCLSGKVETGMQLARTLRMRDADCGIMGCASRPVSAPGPSCMTITTGNEVFPGGIEPTIGTVHDTWSQTRLNDDMLSWTCANGMTCDLAEAIATRINELTTKFPENDVINKHLDSLLIPSHLRGMDLKIARLGHVEETELDAMDVLIRDALAHADLHPYELNTHSVAFAEPMSTAPAPSLVPRAPPPGQSCPPDEPRKGDPATVREMMQDPDWAVPGGWRDKYLDEFLQILDTYKVLVPSTTDDFIKERGLLLKEGKGRQAVIIPTTVVATRKYHADGTFHRLKVRLCAAQNRKRFDMGDAWSPTVGLDSVRFILTIGALTKSYISTYDVSGAYLNGRRSDTDDVIYLRPPPGMEHLNDSLRAQGKSIDPRFRVRDQHGNSVLFRCPGNLYGLQQAGRIWYLHARQWFLGSAMRMKQSNVDPCIFYRQFSDSSFIIVALYVDDSLQIMSNDTVRAWYAKEFERKFDQSPGSGGNSCDFLGMTILQSDDRRVLRVNCPKLWMRLRERLSNFKLPRTSAPLPGDAMQAIYADPSEDNPILTEEQCDVRGILGQLAWGIQASRPAESFHASLLARRAHIPTQRYCSMLLYLSSYCLDHAHDEIMIGAASRERAFHCHVDSSWANDPSNHRSWFGYSLSWAGAAFCTRAKLQPVVALSSRDAEAIAAVYAVKAMLGFIIMMQELGFSPTTPLRIGVDNKATVDGAHSDKITKDSRHQAMRLAWLRDVVRSEIISLTHVSTGKNNADVHTKLLSGPAHARIRANLMGTPLVPAGT